METIKTDKRITFNYKLLESWIAGLILTGPEVKSVKAGQIDLEGSYVTVKNNSLWLMNAKISLYRLARPETQHPNREKKLLLTKKEIAAIIGKSKQKGLTILPYKLYNNKGIVKIEIVLAQGKKKHDKRETIKMREIKRKINRALKN